jgi:hypothetical protein
VMRSQKQTSNSQNKSHDITNSRSRRFRSHVYIFIITLPYILLIDLAELFYLEDNPALQNVDVMTDAGESVASTAFTRYTATLSAMSRTSKQVSVLLRDACNLCLT